MNVAFDPWIPMVTTAGEPKLASLNEVLTEGDKFSDLAVRPHERVALMRLFLCVAHASLNGPTGYDEWCDVPKRLPEEAQKYLRDWKDWFELFHPKKPWLQVAELSKSADSTDFMADGADWTPVSKLNFSFATGNNSTLFDHEGMISEERDIPLHEAIISMVAFQCFSVGGLMGQVYWRGYRCGELANPKKEFGPVKSSDGPCVPASMIHALLRGVNLRRTICINLPTHVDIHFSYGEREIGRPVWEMMPKSLSDSAHINNATKTYVGRLLPLTRLIRLHPSGRRMLLGNGFAYPFFSDGFPQEPTATVVIQNNERKLLSYRPSKAIWRELAAIVVKRKAEGVGGPLSLRAIQDGDECDIVVTALSRDKATIVDTVESVFRIPSRLSIAEGTASYESEVKKSESWSNLLGSAVEVYRREIDDDWENRLERAKQSKWALKARLHSLATTHYWNTVENKLSLLMAHIEAIGSDAAIPTREAWRKMLFSSVCEAYRLACGQETPRQMRAFVKGWQKLTTREDENKSDTNGTKEVKV